MRYTLVAYKPDSYQSYRSCVTANFSPQFVFEKDIDKNKLLKELTAVIYCNKTLEDQETGFETIEILLHDEHGSHWQEHDCETYENLIQQATVLADQQIQAEAVRKTQEVEREQQKAAQDKEVKERVQYEKLKAKFEKKD